LPPGLVRVGSGRLRLIVRRLLLGRFLLLPGRLLAGALLLFPFLGLRHIELNTAAGLTRLFFLLEGLFALIERRHFFTRSESARCGGLYQHRLTFPARAASGKLLLVKRGSFR